MSAIPETFYSRFNGCMKAKGLPAPHELFRDGATAFDSVAHLASVLVTYLQVRGLARAAGTVAASDTALALGDGSVAAEGAGVFETGDAAVSFAQLAGSAAVAAGEGVAGAAVIGGAEMPLAVAGGTALVVLGAWETANAALNAADYIGGALVCFARVGMAPEEIAKIEAILAGGTPQPSVPGPDSAVPTPPPVASPVGSAVKSVMSVIGGLALAGVIIVLVFRFVGNSTPKPPATPGGSSGTSYYLHYNCGGSQQCAADFGGSLIGTRGGAMSQATCDYDLNYWATHNTMQSGGSPTNAGAWCDTSANAG